MSADEREAWAASLFDEVAEAYDQSGVAFFGPIAHGLVDLLAPRPGERVVDIGCGRGALTFTAADAVGPTGLVTAIDIAPMMVELTRRRAQELGLTQVRTQLATGADLGLQAASADVVAASLVLFFTPDRLAALRSWVELLVPGGRIGVTTFGQPDPVWQSLDRLFHPFLPSHVLKAERPVGVDPLTTDDGIEQLFAAAGVSDVRTVRAPLRVRFRHAAQWRDFSMGTGLRAFWQSVPPPERASVFEAATELLEPTRTTDGHLELVHEIRYTVGTTDSAAAGHPTRGATSSPTFRTT